jgi:hypothetical protein
MEWKLLDIRLQMEMLISEREGMIAENMQRAHLGQSMAYTDDNFQINANNLQQLISVLRS